jgi:hypothetical protein
LLITVIKDTVMVEKSQAPKQGMFNDPTPAAKALVEVLKSPLAVPIELQTAWDRYLETTVMTDDLVYIAESVPEPYSGLANTFFARTLGSEELVVEVARPDPEDMNDVTCLAGARLY